MQKFIVDRFAIADYRQTAMVPTQVQHGAWIPLYNDAVLYLLKAVAID